MNDVVLGDVADAHGTRPGAGPFDSVDLDGACCRGADAEHGLEQRRLPGSASAGDGDHLARGDVSVDAMEATPPGDLLLEASDTEPVMSARRGRLDEGWMLDDAHDITCAASTNVSFRHQSRNAARPKAS